MNTAEVKATANGAYDLYTQLSPNLKVQISRSFPAELALTLSVQSGDINKPKANDARTVDYFFAFLDELTATSARHFQRGMNSRQLIQLALSNLERS